MSHQLSLFSEDGYPLEEYKKIEAEYIKRKTAENPDFVYQRMTKGVGENLSGFIDYPDRPRRYRYWYLETKNVPPPKKK